MATESDVITFEELEKTDVISVELVPERKGLFLKHCEYYVSSRRHGTTVTRRYNEFVQLYDVLFAKYPYRAVCRLPPKRVVVNGGSPRFLQRRRAALQRWLTLVARHPVLAHDADLRAFLCESSAKLEKPKHDEFELAGTQGIAGEVSMEHMQVAFEAEQEPLRLVRLGLVRLLQIFERVESRAEAERADMRELGCGLSALAAPAVGDTPRWRPLRDALRGAAQLMSNIPEHQEATEDEESVVKLLLGVDALDAVHALCTRLARGLHAEHAAAARTNPAADLLRRRQRYKIHCQLEEGRVARAYALAALEALPELLRAHAACSARAAALWRDLHHTLASQ